MRVPLVEQELLTHLEHLGSPPVFSGVRVTQSLVFMCIFCRSLFVPLYFFFWSLCCLFCFEIRILITPLVSSNSSYRLFKDCFWYLENKNVVELCRFRIANHKLPIEIGRWNNTNRNGRICIDCKKNEHYFSRPNILNYKLLLSSSKKSELIKISKFIKHINKTVCILQT